MIRTGEKPYQYSYCNKSFSHKHGKKNQHQMAFVTKVAVKQKGLVKIFMQDKDPDPDEDSNHGCIASFSHKHEK